MFLNLTQPISETATKAAVFYRDEITQIFDSEDSAVETARSLVNKFGYKRSLITVKRVPNNSFLRLLAFKLDDLYKDPNAGIHWGLIEEVRAALKDFEQIFEHAS